MMPKLEFCATCRRRV